MGQGDTFDGNFPETGKGIKEEDNVFYVAVTRAKKTLILANSTLSKVMATGIGCQLTPQKPNELTEIESKANEALARANAIPQGSIVPGHVLYKRGDVIELSGIESSLHQGQ